MTLRPALRRVLRDEGGNAMKKTRGTSDAAGLFAEIAARELKSIVAATDQHTLPPPATIRPGG